MVFKTLHIQCNRCKKTFDRLVKQTTPSFYGRITKSLWCPFCKGPITFKYQFDEDNNPSILSMVDPENASLFQPAIPEGGLTARPKGK